MLAVKRYSQESQSEWDSFIESSKNGTFLLQRGYMEYHADRFEDYSLIVKDETKGNIVALLPANKEGSELRSHGGLTYGGFVIDRKMTTPKMLGVFEVSCSFLKSNGFESLLYKTIPTPYHQAPAEEDRYALFRLEADVVRRDALSVVPRGQRSPVQTRRKRGVKAAKKRGLQISNKDNWEEFWSVLTVALRARHGTQPVHTLSEIELLRDRFSDEVRLLTVEAEDGQVVAGTVIYETENVAHAQYIAASEEGRAAGALDFLFEFMISEEFSDKPYFDFGISTEDSGRVLNTGLIEQKEGFGARCVVHDTYRLKL